MRIKLKVSYETFWLIGLTFLAIFAVGQHFVFAEEEVPSALLKLEGRLIEMSKQDFACGGFRVGVVMKYDELKVLDGKFEGNEIYVAHYCPELTRERYSPRSGRLKQFNLNDRHVMELRLLDDPNALVFDDFKNVERAVYECIKVDLAE